MNRLALLAACPALLAVACSVFTPKTSGTHNYAGAAMFAASGVAAAGVNRAVTGYCWAACTPGTTCDRASGMCLPLPCSSKCPADLKCELIGGEYLCVHPKNEALASMLDDAGADAAPGAPSATDASSE
jgi:hypothetical protein